MDFAKYFSKEFFPLHESYLEQCREWWETEAGEEMEASPYGILQSGIPFQLMGFNWEELHEMWDDVREGISALALLARPPKRNSGNSSGTR